MLNLLNNKQRSSHSDTDVPTDRKSTRLNSSHQIISYAVFCLKKKTRGYTKHDTASRQRIVTSDSTGNRPQSSAHSAPHGHGALQSTCARARQLDRGTISCCRV